MNVEVLDRFDAAADVRAKYTWDRNAARITRIAETLIGKRAVAP